MTRVGRRFWALDYKEWVTVVAIERRGRTYTVRRDEQPERPVTYNYPAYLLVSKPGGGNAWYTRT